MPEKTHKRVFERVFHVHIPGGPRQGQSHLAAQSEGGGAQRKDHEACRGHKVGGTKAVEARNRP